MVWTLLLAILAKMGVTFSWRRHQMPVQEIRCDVYLWRMAALLRGYNLPVHLCDELNAHRRECAACSGMYAEQACEAAVQVAEPGHLIVRGKLSSQDQGAQDEHGLDEQAEGRTRVFDGGSVVPHCFGGGDRHSLSGAGISESVR